MSSKWLISLGTRRPTVVPEGRQMARMRRRGLLSSPSPQSPPRFFRPPPRPPPTSPLIPAARTLFACVVRPSRATAPAVFVRSECITSRSFAGRRPSPRQSQSRLCRARCPRPSQCRHCRSRCPRPSRRCRLRRSRCPRPSRCRRCRARWWLAWMHPWWAGEMSPAGSARSSHRPAAKWMRQDFFWSTIEPQPGVFDFTYYDNFVLLAAQHNVHLLPLLFDAPTWAGANRTPHARELCHPHLRAQVGVLSGVVVAVVAVVVVGLVPKRSWSARAGSGGSTPCTKPFPTSTTISTASPCTRTETTSPATAIPRTSNRSGNHLQLRPHDLEALAASPLRLQLRRRPRQQHEP
jgi:hypothetical protein